MFAAIRAGFDQNQCERSVGRQCLVSTCPAERGLLLAVLPMGPFTYRCPRTGLQVQGWAAADPLTDGEIYEPVTCTACERIHLVNAKSGKVLDAAKK
jgi:hypothetical protein